MKLAEVLLKQECRIPEFGFLKFNEADFDMTLTDGVVSISRRIHDDKTPRLVPFTNLVSAKPAVPKK